LGEIQFDKNGGKTQWKRGKGFTEPLGGVEIFQGSVENPLRVFGTGEGCFKCSNVIARAKTNLFNCRFLTSFVKCKTFARKFFRNTYFPRKYCTLLIIV
jgi:hypothetical protein